MLFFLHKYLRSRAPDRRSEPSAGATMAAAGPLPPSSAESPAAACIRGCCPAPRGAGAKHRCSTTTTTTTTVRASRSNFAATATSELFPNVHFTNHESLPPLPLAFSAFLSAFPRFADTDEADRIRDCDYPHLCCHVCLDYSGLGLFSRAQRPPPPLFAIAYRPANLPSLLQYGQPASPLEAAIRRRLMASLNVSDEDYTMVCTASTATAFKLLAESYPFHSHKRLVTVYDHESEAVSAISEVALRRGAAEVSSASFSWPGLRINTAKLKRTVCGRAKKRRRGLFVFPLQSRMSGTRYPYLWMSLARNHGWHVLLDACALGAKDTDTLGLSLIQPDFIICSFFKVFGDDPSGFAALFIKKSSCSVLECSTAAQSIGVVGIVPANATPTPSTEFRSEEDSEQLPPARFSNGEPFELRERELSSEIVEVGNADDSGEQADTTEIECRGLDHADSLGLLLISNRLRYITNWLVIALMKLRHPHSDNSQSLVRIYGPKVKFDRAPAIAFNVFDWKGEKVEPALVQKLADRSNISLSCGFLHNICFSDKYAEEKNSVLERRRINENKRKEKIDVGIAVVNASLGFMTNFEDAYRLWAFVAKFLDADFVEKERWRYMALNQKIVEV